MADRGSTGQGLNEQPLAHTNSELGGRLGWLERVGRRVTAHFRDNDPRFWNAIVPALVVSALLFVRSPVSNYIFDEQEALLANPYVNGEVPWGKLFERDFWGLPSDRSIGSYRPIPNLIWRLLWQISELPWLHHWVNVVGHAVNATLVAGLCLRITGERRLSWLGGACFLTSAVLTETVSGVVGIADVLGGLFVLLAVVALGTRLWLMPLGVFASVFVGLLCKESVLVALPLVAWAALVTAPRLHPLRPWRLPRALLALLGAVAALVAYTYFRRRFFEVELPPELAGPLPDGTSWPRRALHAFLRWFRQPKLPQDPINNPLIDADFPHRVAGALRVYWRGLIQVVFPWQLSGDYSFPQEPIPQRVIFPQSVAGALALVVPPLAAFGVWIRSLFAERRAGSARVGRLALLAVALLWVPIAYFPHSNIPVLLPTVRAERFWYVPVVGTSWLLALVLGKLLERRWGRVRPVVVGLVVAFFGFQAARARWHALDYTDDLTFWRATRKAVPQSAKAHLNYSVMVGARGRLEERLAANRRAIELAPSWPMAHVYYGDALCRMDRPDAAWPHFVKGVRLGPNSSSLVALGLQCLWEKKAIDEHSDELLSLSRQYPGTWLAYLAADIVHNGEKYGGVRPRYRPRAYDQGPKQRKKP